MTNCDKIKYVKEKMATSFNNDYTNNLKKNQYKNISETKAK